MKTLYIVRHAKSSWDNPDLPDKNRPITRKGIERLHKCLKVLTSYNTAPELIISSPALRTYETALVLAEGLGYNKNAIIQNNEFYDACKNDLLDFIYCLSDKINSVMLVGHNPTVTSLSNFFLEEKLDWLPTSGIVSISFETESWSNIHLASKKTNFVIIPKNI